MKYKITAVFENADKPNEEVELGIHRFENMEHFEQTLEVYSEICAYRVGYFVCKNMDFGYIKHYDILAGCFF